MLTKNRLNFCVLYNFYCKLCRSLLPKKVVQRTSSQLLSLKKHRPAPPKGLAAGV